MFLIHVAILKKMKLNTMLENYGDFSKFGYHGFECNESKLFITNAYDLNLNKINFILLIIAS